MVRCHDCADTYLARAEEEVCRQILREHICDNREKEAGYDGDGRWSERPTGHHGRALDVGAGTSGAGRRILEGWEYHAVDFSVQVADSQPNVELQNIQDDRWAKRQAGQFDLVLAKRVLIQMSDSEVERATENMYDLLRPGGHLLCCEPWRAEREALCELRQLPDPESGGKGVPNGPFLWPPYGLDQLVDTPVAPDYVLWTRAMWGILDPEARGQSNAHLAYDDPRRMLYPAFPPEVQQRFAFYRARLWRKV